MAYMSQSNGGYACSSGYCGGSATPSEGYSSPRRQKSVRVLGCTCGGGGPCHGTCRMPVPE